MKRTATYRWIEGLGFAALLGVLTLIAGCHTPRTGSASAEILPAPTPPDVGDKSALDHATLHQGDTHTDTIPAASVGPTPLPIYPPEALKARAPDYTLILTVTLDENGAVSDIKRAMGDVELPNPFAAQFRAAAEAAIRSWKFTPAVRNTYRVRSGRPDRLIDSEKVPDDFDIKYAFASNGRVR